MHDNLSRRDFLRSSGALAAVHAWPSVARFQSPSGKLQTAHIGVGGMGRADLRAVSSHPQVEVVGLCDVDRKHLDAAQQQHPGAQAYRDYRDMLAELGDAVDAVVVSTPDHTHAPAAMSALNLGKPVYCQKPLTHEVFEARRLREAAEARQIPTQMGIQVHASDVYRQAVKMIQSGVIGPVSEVHAWSSKNWGHDGPPPEEASPPEALDWDRWVGVAEMRSYAPRAYHPGAWRKTIDFGTGTLGDMGVHIFDTPYAALQLGAPNWVETTCRPPTGFGHPERNIVQLEFPGTQYTKPVVSCTWYDGGSAPPDRGQFKVPADLELPGQGSLFLGAEGTMLLPHIGEAVLFPREKFANYRPPQVQPGNHYHEWIEACLGHGATSAGFSYAGPLTEALLLGVVANRFPSSRLCWNAEQLSITNLPEANDLLRRQYREGFEVEGL